LGSGEGVSPSPVGVGSAEGAVPPPQKNFGIFSFEMVHFMHSGARFRPTRPITAIMMFITSAEIMRPPEFRPPADHIHTTVNFFHSQRGAQAQGPPPKYAPVCTRPLCNFLPKINLQTLYISTLANRLSFPLC